MMGPDGLRRATETAILAANYIAARLDAAFPVLYTGANGRVAHECIVDLRQITKETGVTVDDVAKRLIDFGFHAPTMSFPVAGTLMIEPTESEDLAELDRFCDAMLAIRAEIDAVASGSVAVELSPLRHAPHTAEDLLGDWDRGYSRATAAFPDSRLRADKYFPPVSRIDGAYGDRHLICSCEPLENFERAAARRSLEQLMTSPSRRAQRAERRRRRSVRWRTHIRQIGGRPLGWAGDCRRPVTRCAATVVGDRDLRFGRRARVRARVLDRQQRFGGQQRAPAPTIAADVDRRPHDRHLGRADARLDHDHGVDQSTAVTTSTVTVSSTIDLAERVRARRRGRRPGGRRPPDPRRADRQHPALDDRSPAVGCEHAHDRGRLPRRRRGLRDRV